MKAAATTLEQLCESARKITYGVVKPGHEVEDGVRFIRGGDVFQGRIAEDVLRTISPQLSDQYKRTILQGGELLVSLVGNPGEVAVVPERLAGANIARQVGLVPLGPQASPNFVMYFLRSPLGRAQLFARTQGAVQQVINLADLKTIEVPDLSLDVQDRIASILSTYDDIIENNRRRIQLLEQAARLLYKEWFVHLRFPGHEHVKIKDGVPDGWERHALTDLAENVSYGYTASSSQEEVGPKFLRITDIVPPVLNWDEVPYCEATTEDIQRNRLEVGDIVVARTGATVGYAKLISYLECQAVYASYLVRFRFRTPVMSIIAGIFMESDAYKDHVRNHAGGAAQPNANAKVLGSAVLLLPPQILQDQFSDFVSRIVSQRDTLIRQNSRLSKARDLLLPRLMNGEVII